MSIRNFTSNSIERRVTVPSSLKRKTPAPPLDLEFLSSLPVMIPSALERLQAQYDTLVIENEQLFDCCKRKEGGSRRFRKHKRSAARRRGTASRRRYKNRK
jgi:hypothetical protein